LDLWLLLLAQQLVVSMVLTYLFQGMEQVLQNINRLNRNLESVIAVSTAIDCTLLGEDLLLIDLLPGWE
jgi:hypothetical protein